MAFVIGLIAAATRILSSDDSSSPGYNGNGHSYNNNRRHNNAPRAASAAGRRVDRRTDRIASRASDAATAMSLMSSGSGSRSAAPAPPQPTPPCMNHGEGPAPRGVYHSSEARGSMAGSYRDQVPAGAPEGYRWRDEQSYNRPVGQRGRDRDLGAGAGSVNDLPPYEQVVHRPRKS
ncbi:uncharacterized protein TrAtP1_005972 [Trichoderma atroviride]|uniref:uncharacterized protein n=1 Tax=Hypocrea atroviridis TaxID=63577 RepID=UPI0033192680|nr:hypothetical protein TrAtP1_005972 [Trichoderma atroviride]